MNHWSPIMMPVTGYLMEAALLPDTGEELRLVVGGDRLRRLGGTSRASAPTLAAAAEAMDAIHVGVTKLILGQWQTGCKLSWEHRVLF
jgi:hypothetical protein